MKRAIVAAAILSMSFPRACLACARNPGFRTAKTRDSSRGHARDDTTRNQARGALSLQ